MCLALSPECQVSVFQQLSERGSPPQFPPVDYGGIVRSFRSTPLFAYPSKTRTQTHPALLYFLPSSFFHL